MKNHPNYLDTISFIFIVGLAVIVIAISGNPNRPPEKLKIPYSQPLISHDPKIIPKITAMHEADIPPDVMGASSKKLKIKVVFTSEVDMTIITSGQGHSEGTGFAILTKNKKDKVILTARHILFDDDRPPRPQPPDGSRFSVTTDGLISFSYYKYRVYAIDSRGQIYNLTQVGIGRKGTDEDFVAFQVIGDDKDLPFLDLEKEVELGDRVYTTGIAPVVSFSDPSSVSDIIDTPFGGIMTAKIERHSQDTKRLKKLYRVAVKAGPGFSGGPLLNNKGQATGMISFVYWWFGFTYVISSEDLESFVDSLILNNPA